MTLTYSHSPDPIFDRRSLTLLLLILLILTDDRILEKEKEVRAEFAALHEGREQMSDTVSQHAVDINHNTEEEMALWIKKWQRHFDIMQRQESDLRERLTEYGFNPTSELTRGAEVSDSDDHIDEDDENSSGMMMEEEEVAVKIKEDGETSNDALEAVYWMEPKDNVAARPVDTNTNQESKSKAKKTISTKPNLAKVLLRDDHVFPEHEQMMNEKEAAFYKMTDAQLKSNGMMAMDDGVGQKMHPSNNGSSSNGGSSSSSSSSSGAKKVGQDSREDDDEDEEDRWVEEVVFDPIDPHLLAKYTARAEQDERITRWNKDADIDPSLYPSSFELVCPVSVLKALKYTDRNTATFRTICREYAVPRPVAIVMHFVGGATRRYDYSFAHRVHPAVLR